MAKCKFWKERVEGSIGKCTHSHINGFCGCGNDTDMCDIPMPDDEPERDA